MMSNDIIIRVQFETLSFRKEDTNYLMTRGCVSLLCFIFSWSMYEKLHGTICFYFPFSVFRPTSHKFSARCDQNLKPFEWLPLLTQRSQFTDGAIIARPVPLVHIFHDWLFTVAKPMLTYVVLVVSQDRTKSHKILGWRCSSCTEGDVRGWIFRPQK